MTPEENEKAVSDDMKSQMEWTKLLNPFASILKFRLPYYPGKTNYFKGDLYLPIFGRRNTTECRMMVNRNQMNKIQQFDNIKFCNQMYYFNHVIRYKCYPHSIKKTEFGIDNCYDCRCEILILTHYLLNRNVYQFQFDNNSNKETNKESIGNEEINSDKETNSNKETNNNNELNMKEINEKVANLMNEISRNISSRNRTLLHKPQFQEFYFNPTLHLNENQRNNKDIFIKMIKILLNNQQNTYGKNIKINHACLIFDFMVYNKFLVN
jgi:hypothetical protein